MLTHHAQFYVSIHIKRLNGLCCECWNGQSQWGSTFGLTLFQDWEWAQVYELSENALCATKSYRLVAAQLLCRQPCIGPVRPCRQTCWLLVADGKDDVFHMMRASIVFCICHGFNPMPCRHASSESTSESICASGRDSGRDQGWEGSARHCQMRAWHMLLAHRLSCCKKASWN